MNIPKTKIFSHTGIAILALSIATMASGFAPPPGKGGGNGGGKGGAPPATVMDLAVTGFSHDSVTLEWTASGANGIEGTAAAYEIRYLINQPITDANWGDTFRTYKEPKPQPAGSAETFTIHHFKGDRIYDIRLKVINEAGRASELSNPVVGFTPVTLPGEWDPELLTQISSSDDGDFDFDPGDGQPSVAFGDQTNNMLWFAHFDGAAWTVEPLLPGEGWAKVGLQYDPWGRPTVTISGSGINGVLFATRTVSGWSFETIDSGNVDTPNHRPVYDAAGNPTVVYRTRDLTGKGKNQIVTNSLHYAERVGGVWQRETIDVLPLISAFSLVYDLGGNAAVSYRATNADGVRELRLARRTGPGVWAIQTVRAYPNGSVARTSLAFDPITSMPMIAYRFHESSTGSSTLHAARFDGMAWQFEVVDPVTRVDNPVLLFDATSAPVIAYSHTDNIREQVLLARFNGTAWVIEAADDVPAPPPDVGGSFGAVRFRYDAFSDPWLLFGLWRGSTGIPNNSELFLTRRVGN